MTAFPVVDASWHRVPQDTFSSCPSSSTPLDASSCIPDNADDSDESGSDWSYEDQEQLITLDLGTDRIARRALLGYSAGLDQLDPQPAPASSASTRTVRGRTSGVGVDAAKQSKSSTALTAASDLSSSSSGRSGPHLGAGKMLSITGLDTATPLMKIDDTVLRGKRMDMFGSEIVLVDHFDPTRPKASRHRLRPISPSNSSEMRATTWSTTTRTRILFRPIYDPSSRETAAGETAAYDALRALVKPSLSHHVNVPTPGSEQHQQRGATSGPSLASVTDLMGTESGAGDESAEPEKKVGRGKYKRKQVSEEEQMIRAAERKIRKAAKAHFKQQEEQQQQTSATHESHVQGEGEGEEQENILAQQQHGAIHDESQPMPAQPPPPFDAS